MAVDGASDGSLSGGVYGMDGMDTHDSLMGFLFNGTQALLSKLEAPQTPHSNDT